MDLLLWLIFGAITGWLASIFMHNDAAQGTMMDIILGILGAFVGGIIMNFLGQPGVTGFNLYSMIVAVIGSMVLIWIGRRLR